MNKQLLKQISAELTLWQYNQIPVLALKHAVGEAKIALQGAQLLSWKPKGESADLLWLSEIDPFEQGVAIRGGVPICYPWFGGVQQPPHGTARIRLWELTDYVSDAEKVRLEFGLFDEHHQMEAKVEMQFDKQCQVCFTHFGNEPAQAALHTYFNVGDITQVAVQNLPLVCFNALTQQQENAPPTRRIEQSVDSIYPIEQNTQQIVDTKWQRCIEVEHRNATEIVLWNPWHKAMSAMRETDYQQMLCLETARLSHKLEKGDWVGVVISRG